MPCRGRAPTKLAIGAALTLVAALLSLGSLYCVASSQASPRQQRTWRRSWTKGEIGLAFKRLRELPKGEGGTKRKMGRPAVTDEKSGSGSRHSRARDEAAAILGLGEQEARALEKVFATPGVPLSSRAPSTEARLRQRRLRRP